MVQAEVARTAAEMVRCQLFRTAGALYYTLGDRPVAVGRDLAGKSIRILPFWVALNAAGDSVRGKGVIFGSSARPVAAEGCTPACTL